MTPDYVDFLYIVQVLALSLATIGAIVSLVIIVLIFKNGAGK